MRESLRYAEQNLYTQAQKLVGDRNPKLHELTVQVRALDESKSGADIGLPALVALASALIGKSEHGGMICVGSLNLGGGIETIYNVASVVELAAERGATTLLMPAATRRDVMNLSDEIAGVDVRFYTDARYAFPKAIADYEGTLTWHGVNASSLAAAHQQPLPVSRFQVSAAGRFAGGVVPELVT